VREKQLPLDDQRLGPLLTSSPFLITTRRREVARLRMGSRWPFFSIAGAVPAMTTIRLPILVWFMVVPVRVMTNDNYQLYTDDHVPCQLPAELVGRRRSWPTRRSPGTRRAGPG
jgi:hypothetical protein